MEYSGNFQISIDVDLVSLSVVGLRVMPKCLLPFRYSTKQHMYHLDYQSCLGQEGFASLGRMKPAGLSHLSR